MTTAKPIRPVFDEMQEAAIENGYRMRREIEGVVIATNFDRAAGCAAMSVRDTLSGLQFQVIDIDSNRIEQVARIIVTGVCAERTTCAPSGPSVAEPSGMSDPARPHRQP